MLDTKRRSVRRAGPFTKALLLVAVLVLVWFASNRLWSRGLPGSFTGLFTGEQGRPRGYQAFDPEAQQALVRLVAGFWSADPGGPDRRGPLRCRDRIEIKDNGIVWRVIAHTVRMPGGDSALFVHVYDAYLRPFGWVRGEDSVMACDVRVLRQARIAGTDTCYGPTDVDTVWEVGVEAGGVGLAGVRYARYSGELRAFFPAGLVSMLEDAYRGGGPRGTQAGYQVGKGEVRVPKGASVPRPTVTFELRRCGPEMAPVPFARRALAGALAALAQPPADASALAALTDTTYGALLRLDIRQRYGSTGQGAALRVEVAADGLARVVSVEGAAPLSDSIAALARQHSHDWRFPSRAFGPSAFSLPL